MILVDISLVCFLVIVYLRRMLIKIISILSSLRTSRSLWTI